MIVRVSARRAARDREGEVTESRAPIAFFDKTYTEALEVLEDARDFMAHGEARGRERLEPFERLLMSSETMRVTSRLAQVVAWTMVQKAVDAGEMTQADALGEEHRPAAREVCLASLPEDAGWMPAELLRLLETSRNLYVRVVRLDELMRRAL